ncbi:circadian clock KaiB family protein [Mucilaginibacter sp.]|jgi:circadian clock protein KaiB|uniref:circadian clock KaiB family protein n=1 Tax=Mucilaginibacter sp. TaxID=1882438 RepID=UPI002BEB3DA2|nr:circadian clock KaiB family protein [Mucilaginibacter sp.]HTI58559.1 circadian clock KaiB family protein [Mucilaginibacter sp.]
MKKAATESDWGKEEERPFVLRLYVAGSSPNSVRAITNLKAICEKYLEGNYELEIIDVHQQVQKAGDRQLIALPMLLKESPGMERRLIGDMSDTKKVLKGLGIKETGV